MNNNFQLLIHQYSIGNFQVSPPRHIAMDVIDTRSIIPRYQCKAAKTNAAFLTMWRRKLTKHGILQNLALVRLKTLTDHIEAVQCKFSIWFQDFIFCPTITIICIFTCYVFGQMLLLATLQSPQFGNWPYFGSFTSLP